MIGGMPAARAGDMHTCPMVCPAPPAIPHVGGPITMGVPTVMIGGMPAATVGSICTCTGPPDSVMMGCNTVLIGTGGGGGGGAGASGSGQQASAQADAGEGPQSHYLDVKFVDKGGKPITGIGYAVEGPDGKISKGNLSGRIKKGGIEEGSYKITLIAITEAKWSKAKAKVGDEVKLTATTSGIEDGTKAVFQIFIKDPNFADKGLASLEADVNGDKAEVDWELQVDDNLLEIHDEKEKGGGYSNPSFYFIVTAGGQTQRSALLKYDDVVEITLTDRDGNPIGGAKYKMRLPNGQIREGTLDSNGKGKEENVPPGRVRVSYEINNDR
jgi:uncharacterized Zn-binding protein involved in type VI secretion